ncbi:MAG: hypothetical protein ACYTGR_17730, partial [Planctomycetota bacterium]
WKDVIPVGAAWTWEGSQLRQRFVNMADKLRGRPLLDGVADDDPAQIITAWNAFPIRAGWGLDARVIVTVLWIFWSVLGLASVGVVIGLVQAWRQLPADGEPEHVTA